MKKVNKAGVDARAERTKRSFNFVDVLLILFVIAVIFVAVNIVAPMAFVSKLTSDSTRTIEYTVELEGVDKALAEKIKENDTVVDAVSKNALGTVSSVDSNTEYSVFDERTGVLVYYEDRVNVLITVTASASYNKGEGYAVGERRIAVGEKLSLRFPDFSGEGYCIGLS